MAQHHHYQHNSPELVMIRPATLGDLDDLASVLANAAFGDPIYPYRYPSMYRKPDAFARFCKQKCVEYLYNNEVVHVYVMQDDQDPSRLRVVALCIWERHGPGSSGPATATGTPQYATLLPRSNTNTTTTGQYQAASMRDERPERVRAFRETLAHAKTSCFDDHFTDGYYFLKLLLCHPTYQRRGVGTALVSWGIEQARRDGLRVALFSSPMGLPLYRKLGFKEVDRVRVQVPGDNEYLDIPAMAMRPRGSMRREPRVQTRVVTLPRRRRQSIA